MLHQNSGSGVYVLGEIRFGKEKGFAKGAEAVLHFDKTLDWVPTR